MHRHTADTPAQMQSSARHELVLINSNVRNYRQLLADLRANNVNRAIEFIMLDANRNGIDQISQILAGRAAVTSLHLIAHGENGRIELGNSALTAATLRQHGDAMAHWGDAMTATADILFYGCRIAAGGDGQTLLDTIAALTGLGVAASDDLTGHQALGGDWELEYRAGTVESQTVFSANAKGHWRGVLAPPVANDDYYTVREKGFLSVDGGGFTAVSTIDSTDADHYDITTADLDADGDIDIVGGASTGDTISWYENDGNGLFTEHIIDTPDRPDTVIIADIDGDGDLDIAAAIDNDNAIVWYENDGNENFTKHSVDNAVISASGVDVMDVDSDGDMDLVSSSYINNTIYWHENDGNENFTTRTIATGADGVEKVIAWDINQDGNIDVVSTNRQGLEIAWYENDGSENFAYHQVISGLIDTYEVDVADIDQDGDFDLAVSDYSDDTVSWYENDGSENFTRHIISTGTAIPGPENIYLDDVDGDGNLDFLITSYDRGEVHLYRNDGSANFAATQQIWSGISANDVEAADLNDDGNLDVVVANILGNSLEWVRNDGLNITSNDTDADLDPLSVALIDDVDNGVLVLDADGTFTYTPNPGFTGTDSFIYEANDGNLGTDQATVTITVTPFAGFTVIESGGSVAVNESGATDTFTVVLDVQPASNVVINIASSDTGEATVSPASLTFTPGNWDTAQTVTVTGVDDVIVDGTQNTTITLAVNDAASDDIFDTLADQTISAATADNDSAPVTNDDYYTVRENGSLSVDGGGFTGSAVIDAGATGAHNVVTADLDQDGDLDIVAAAYDDGDVLWYENDGTGVFTRYTIDANVDGAIQVFIVDVNDDGYLDVLAAADVGSSVSWHENDGNEGFTTHIISDLVTNATSVYGADIDGDGDMDVVSSSWQSDTIYWHENDGSQNFTMRTVYTAAARAHDVHALDFDQDGDIDILSASANDDTVAWYENDGNENFTYHAISTTVDGVEKIRISDLDQDGDWDVIAAGTTEGAISWFENDGNENFNENMIDASSNDPFETHVADVDNDGDLDVLAGTWDGGELVWYANDGNENFSPPEKIHNGRRISSVSSADFNNDGNLDIVSSDITDNEIVWHLNSGETVIANDTDADFDPLSVALIDNVDNGVLMLNADGTFTYIPNPGFTGTDSFIYRANDGNLGTDQATVTITVTPVAGFTVIESGGSTAVNESGTTDSFTVVLDVQPNSNVVFDLSSGDTGEATVLPGSLTFTPANWNSAQTVSVTGVDDAVIDGSQNTTITVSVNDAASDDAFDALASQTVSAATADNDSSLDDDFDGIPNAVEGMVDTDLDGTADAQDTDSDNDGIPDKLEETNMPPLSGIDSDTDGLDDLIDVDSTGGVDSNFNGIDDLFELLDSDADATPDYLDVDSDNDGIPDGLEAGNIPLLANNDSDNDGVDDALDTDLTAGNDNNGNGFDDAFEPRNTDGADLPDYLDIDSDNDGILDGTEADVQGADVDGDGIDNQYDVDQTAGVDADGDGVDDAAATDTDGDGRADFRDLDSDNDGLPDVIEAGLADGNQDGLVDDAVTTDAPPDSDTDSIPDYRDPDSDNDIVFDIVDAGHTAYDLDMDGRIDPSFFVDPDFDGVATVIDFAPSIFGLLNDADNDDLANNLDLDDDNDGIPDALEAPDGIDRDSDGDGHVDRLDLDSDNDGIADSIEAFVSNDLDRDYDGVMDDLSDADNNGLVDSVAPDMLPVDTDADGTPDYLDIDSDGDELYDITELTLADVGAYDADADGRLDSLLDSDGDGLMDNVDPLGGDAMAMVPPDSDGDGIANFRDIDSDNDGFDDTLETGDFNQNGVQDYLEDGGGITTSVSGGGGGLGLHFIGFLMIIYHISKKTRATALISRHTVIRQAVFFCVLFATAVSAQEAELDKAFQSIWYAAAGIGSSRLEPEGESAGFVDNGKNSTGTKLVFGQRFKPRWAWEIAYLDAGAAELSNPNPAIRTIIPNAKIKYDISSVLVNYYLKDHQSRFNLFAKAGASFISTAASDSRITVKNDASTQLALGLGAEYRFAGNWFLRLEHESHAKDAGYSGLSVGFSFGASPPARPNKPKRIPIVIEYPLYVPEEQVAVLAEDRQTLNDIADELTQVSAELLKAVENGNGVKSAQLVEQVGILNDSSQRLALVEESILETSRLPDEVVWADHLYNAEGQPLLATPAEQASELRAVQTMIGGVQSNVDEWPVIQTKLSRVRGRIAVVEESLLFIPPWEKTQAEALCQTFVKEQQNIKFRPESRRLTQDSKTVLDNIAGLMQRNRRVILELQAHTDSWGTFAFNQELSHQRAAAVAQYLQDKGVAAQRVTIQGYGEIKPIASNQTPEGRSLNRRVELVIKNPNICKHQSPPIKGQG